MIAEARPKSRSCAYQFVVVVLLLFVGIYAVAAVCWMFLDPRGLVASDQPVA